MDEFVLAIDIGGTKMALALVAADGTIRREQVCPTLPVADPEEVFAPCAAAIRELLADCPRTDRSITDHPGPLRVGIGSAGPINGPAGHVSPVNIPAWREYPIVERVHTVVAEATGSEPTVLLAGDGHCIALGEHWLGAGRDLDSMVGMVVSTGIGGGAVLDGRLFAGHTGNAVHVGHTSVNAFGEQCVCGSHGCVEMYARGPAMVAAAQQQGWVGEDAKDLTRDARAGHPVAVAAIDHGMRALAAGIAATATQLDVATFVIGGGVAKAGAVIFDPLRAHLPDFAVLPYVAHLELRAAELDNAGLIGAAALALQG
ncbi:MAG: ROK family protein [Propionibacteriaceae bacterium]